jgi:hypothetical protein
MSIGVFCGMVNAEAEVRLLAAKKNITRKKGKAVVCVVAFCWG